MRRHPLIARAGAAGAAVVSLTALIMLWQLRPGLPQISSLTAPLTTAIIQQGLVCIVWLLAAYVALSVLIRAAQATVHHAPSRRAMALPGVIPSAPPPRPRAAAPRTTPTRFSLTFAPRPARTAADALVSRVALVPPPTATSPDASGLLAPAATQNRPALSISVLGPFRVSGAKRALKRAATRELIAYLALQPKGASRDELIEALWPAQDPERTRPRFWQSVTDARGALADAWVHDGERYQLDRAKVNIDLDQLEQLLASTDPEHDDPKALETAIGLWRGEPLEGTDYAWADGHVRRLRATLLELLERAGHSRLQSGDARGALEVAEQAITLDQFHEASWRLALQAEHTLGLRESITRRYDELADALDEQLGLQPSCETRVMYRQLLGQA
jgi:prepilin-type processing-associated H-X9-DG protein